MTLRTLPLPLTAEATNLPPEDAEVAQALATVHQVMGLPPPPLPPLVSLPPALPLLPLPPLPPLRPLSLLLRASCCPRQYAS
tara:strand:- start:31 stop:276 length:246 start_codon:yes stop_codon:yes gene_type:complete